MLPANLWVQSLLHADFRWTKNQKLRKLSAARLRVHFGRVMGCVMSQCVSSDLAAEQMAAGDAYQAQSDERVERAVMRQKEAQRAVRLACFVVLAIVALVAWFYLQR